VLLLTLECISFSQNLVINPGFEIWEKINKPVGWTTAQNCLIDSAYINSGNYSCRHEGGTTTKYLGQTIAVLPGNQYQFSLLFKTEITGNGNGCRIWCYWKDAAGNITDPSTDSKLRPSGYLKSDTWKEFSVDIISPPNAISFYLEVRTYPNSITYWDDLVFKENVTTFEPQEKLSDVMIYPNPAHDYLIISNISYFQHIDIQDLTGRCLWSSCLDGEDTATIPISGLADGLYIMRIRTSDKIITMKFIKK